MSRLLAIYRAVVTAREIDRVAQELTSRGEAFFHVSGAGHEASAALAPHLINADWLHCHYRDKALMIARGVSIRSFFDSLYCKDLSSSRGRQISCMMSDRRLNLLSMVTPVGNSGLHAVGIAETIRDELERPIVLCAVGDGTTQEGEFLEACAEASRSVVPVLFLIENNHWAISTPTAGKTFYDLRGDCPVEFHGIPIHRFDGAEIPLLVDQLGQVVEEQRRRRTPQIVVLDVERLASHSNADDQAIYREAEELRRAKRCRDPLLRLERHLLERGVAESVLEGIRRQVAADVARAEEEAYAGPEPAPQASAKRPLTVELTHPSRERRGDARGGPLTMRDAIRKVLRHHLRTDERVTLFGEDIEDPKGDVFGVTKGLSSEFPQRVRNAPLSESTIVGVSIGRALAGRRPVAFLQFADFLPLAYNQIACELGTMHWRSDGQWHAPVILMVPCGAYRPGLGPFHAQTFESLAAHTPGIDVFMPSTASDAAGLLNAAFQSQRPTLFFYPKSCLNDPSQGTAADVANQFVPIGPCRRVRTGRDLTFVAWGNTVRLCERAATELAKAGVEAEILDLRTLSPWDERAVLASAEKTAHLIVVHEDNLTCGFGAEVLATVAEKARVPVAMRRVTRPDTHVPCHFACQLEILPSFKRVLTVAAELLDIDLAWTSPPEPETGFAYVEAIGSGPSDETVIVSELYVRHGDAIRPGDSVAALEATKSVFELTSSISGTVAEILVGEGETVPVGTPLLKVRAGEEPARPKPMAREQPGTPVLSRKPQEGRLRLPIRTTAPRRFDVGISSIAAVTGSRLVRNADLLRDGLAGSLRTAEDILKRTGIETRYWADQGETAVQLAVRACRELLERESLVPEDLDVVICTTTSPTSIAPSMACQVLRSLAGGSTGALPQAYDIHAACSGYLYALQAGYDHLQSTPHGRVLVVTAEVLSPLLDPNDFDTMVLFGDAASATLLYGESHFAQASGRLYRPELSAKGDVDAALSVPLMNSGYIQMKGRKVFAEAVRAMISSLQRVCHREGIAIGDLNLIVPHQANQRILDAIQSRVQTRVFSNIRRHGNTSSSSIPLCLADVLPGVRKGDRLGLCAFGGGFTYGASILQCVSPGSP